MGCKELIDSLKKAGDERTRKLWQDAEADGGKILADVARRVEQLREDMSRKKALMAGDRISRAVSEANSRARIIRLSAEKALSDRLYAAAQASLPALRRGSSEAQFEALARELPPLAWQIVSVNPDDVALAKKHFPGAEITANDRITGGMDAAAQNGDIRVINTFEKRLERAWGDMQPELIKDAYREVKDEASSAAARRAGLSDRISSDEDKRQAVASDR
jgi:V/A-type H+-transporting ATPase subunit E